MKKSILERFLNKYNLGGAVESVNWKSAADGKVVAEFISDDKNVVGEVKTDGITLEEGSYSVYNTSDLKRLIGILDDEINIKVQSTGDKNTGLIFSDKSSKITFVLADEVNIPEVPTVREPTDYEIVISLDSATMERYVKSFGALADIETFTVTSDGKKVSLILGYTNINSNRVTLSVDASKTTRMNPTSFHARYFKDILLANKDAESGELYIAEGGLAKIVFRVTDFTVQYYLPEIKVED